MNMSEMSSLSMPPVLCDDVQIVPLAVLADYLLVFDVIRILITSGTKINRIQLQYNVKSVVEFHNE